MPGNLVNVGVPNFDRPKRVPNYTFDTIATAGDPELRTRVAHDTAAALLARVRANPESDIVQRVIEYTDMHGIDVFAELWSGAQPRTLPGALWRLYLLRALIVQDAESLSFAYQRGLAMIHTIDPIVAGAADPAGPSEIVKLADTILRGVFVGDFAVSLERAAAFSRIASRGIMDLADAADAADAGAIQLGASAAAGTETPHGESRSWSEALTRQAARFSDMAADLSGSAKLWRLGQLD